MLFSLSLGVRRVDMVVVGNRGILVAMRVTMAKKVREDGTTCFFWVGFLSCLYALPLVK